MEGPNSFQNTEQNSTKQTQIAVLMVPFLAQSHLNLLLHLSSVLASYKIPVHYAAPVTHNRQAKLRRQARDVEDLSDIHFHDLQLPSFSSPPPKEDGSTRFPVHLQPVFEASLHLRQQLGELLKQLSLNHKRVIVIHDSMMSHSVQDLKLIQNAESYTFIPISAFSLFFIIWDQLTEKPFQLDSDVPSYIPSMEGCITPEFADLMALQDNDFESGRIYNSCRLIEGKYLKLQEQLSPNPNIRHFAVGPFFTLEVKSRSDENRHKCLQWLDKQEMNSVLYISFGTTTSFSDVQVRELAIGLENSQQKFIWVLRKADRGDIFVGDDLTSHQLPEGYEERVKDRGLVIKDWAPQLDILAHSSTGGFMSHCGWNSCLESIAMGVPIVAWPMHSDQPRNAVLLTEVLRIGTAIKDWTVEVELILSNSIEDAVRKLMASEEGKDIRKRAAELGEAVRLSVAKGGAVHSELESFIAHITRD